MPRNQFNSVVQLLSQLAPRFPEISVGFIKEAMSRFETDPKQRIYVVELISPWVPHLRLDLSTLNLSSSLQSASGDVTLSRHPAMECVELFCRASVAHPDVFIC